MRVFLQRLGTFRLKPLMAPRLVVLDGGLVGLGSKL